MSYAFDVETALGKMPGLKIAVFGDFCVDAYWSLDTTVEELSVETGLALRRVREQRYSLGGAGNVVANLLDLGVGSVFAIGVAGDDLFGGQLKKLLSVAGADLSCFETVTEWQTMVYAKPMMGEVEDHRLDFGAFNALSTAVQTKLAHSLAEAAKVCDVIIVNQQVPGGVATGAMVEKLNAVMREHPEVLFLLDARHTASAFGPAVLKMNAEEILRYAGEDSAHSLPLARARELATKTSKKTGRPMFLTRGEYGMVVADGDTVGVVPGLRIDGPIDTVGAGDAVISALAASLGSGQDPVSAAHLANIAAMITVRKLRTTGTASPAEIRAALPSLAYVVEPEATA